MPYNKQNATNTKNNNQSTKNANLMDAPTAPATHMTARQSRRPSKPRSITTTIKDTPSRPAIVKLFDLQLLGNDTEPKIEESLGNVTAVDIQQGTVSDDTCQVEPCQKQK